MLQKVEVTQDLFNLAAIISQKFLQVPYINPHFKKRHDMTQMFLYIDGVI